MTEFTSTGYLNMELLRFTTAGSVDDGKSTLIGRLLYDSKSIFDDQYEAIKRSSEKRGEDYVNLALLTDGLRAEREQGITIDVAYRYFATPRRKFIIADTPGHIQYTRNMVTGASTAQLAIILIDAQKGYFNQMMGMMMAINMAHHYLGHYAKYANQLAGSGANEKMGAINDLLTPAEWEAAVKAGALDGLNCAYSTEGLRVMFEALQAMPTRPAWTAYIAPQKVDLKKLNKELARFEEDFFHGRIKNL